VVVDDEVYCLQSSANGALIMTIQLLENLKTNSPTWLKPLLTQLEINSKFGCVLTASKAIAVCPREPIILGESAWLHIVIPGVNEKLLEKIEFDLGYRNNDPSIDVLTLGLPHVTGGYDFDHYVPKQIKELLSVTNGLSLFGGHLRIWGIQTKSAKLRNTFYSDVKIHDGEMTSYNIWSRPKNLKHKILVFGVYPSNGSILYMREGDDSVYNSDRNGNEHYKSWPSIAEWLQSEIKRLSLLFDERGYLIPNVSATNP